MRAFKTESKNLLNMKIVVNYLNFIFHVEVENFEFRFSIYQKDEMALWVHGLDRLCLTNRSRQPVT